MADTGYLQVYTGDGKGKTTAAIGLAIRALGAGKRIMLLQFMKRKAYSEHVILNHLSADLTVKTTGKPFFIAEEGMLTEEAAKDWGDDIVIFPKGQPPADYVKLMRQALREAEAALTSGAYDLVILDEINVALCFGLMDEAEMKAVLMRRLPSVEVVCTGRNAPKWLVESADLVTEMKEIKHYYQNGVQAREGIEN